MEVRLSKSEMFTAGVIGLFRRLESLGRDKHGSQAGWEDEIEGACAEKAVAKLLDVYYDESVGRFRGSTLGDVGQLEVRWTGRPDGCLIIRPDDNMSRRFVLVTGNLGAYRVPGWITGRDARRDEWHKAPNGRPPAWFVPQRNLTPFAPRRVTANAQTALFDEAS